MQFEKHRKARKIFEEIDKNPSNYLIIHYSCESFYDIEDGHTPRVTSIAAYSYSTGQTESFSMHKTAERRGIPFNAIEQNYDDLERSMLDEFYEYVNEHKTLNWIHWNMRDINYGFKAIEHRYQVLGGKPSIINDSNRIDLARLLKDCYGDSYAEHPRIPKLLEQNGIKAKDFLTGQEEAEAFRSKEYIKLHQSTLRKVSEFACILDRAINNKLTVRTKWSDIYGLSPQGIFEYLRNKWWVQILLFIIGLILGAIVGKFI
ncbi:hypothetical protein [Gordonibacter urolithinfaciens]|uniref:hypothetical protein n=1 Tax=Gordonibacter urolithinfaciens TaxID=1335613 RepID=UPI003AAC468D